jgi:hypothetical protein
MRTRTKLTGIFAALAFTAFAGCSDHPVGTAQRPEVVAPAYDGIGWTGSGGRSDTTTTTQEQAATTSDSNTTSTPGIGWTGSGN